MPFNRIFLQFYSFCLRIIPQASTIKQLRVTTVTTAPAISTIRKHRASSRVAEARMNIVVGVIVHSVFLSSVK